jgi:hypothetical protein
MPQSRVPRDGYASDILGKSATLRHDSKGETPKVYLLNGKVVSGTDPRIPSREDRCISSAQVLRIRKKKQFCSPDRFTFRESES